MDDRHDRMIRDLTGHLPLHDFHLRFRINDGVKHLNRLNQSYSPERRRKMNVYTVALLTRLVTLNHCTKVPVQVYAEKLHAFVVRKTNLDDLGNARPMRRFPARSSDREADMLEALSLVFQEQNVV